MRERVAIIVNPRAGRGRARDIAERFRDILRAKGTSASVLESALPGDAQRRAGEIGCAVDALVSVGGDGTLNEVINGLAEAEYTTPVAVLPAGTGNVIAQAVRLPSDLERLAAIVCDGPVRTLDLPLANGRHFLMCSGIGFDAHIVHRVHRRRTDKGITLAAYVWPFLKTLRKYTYPRMKVYVDGELVESESTFTVVGNMRHYGGPFRFFNEARPDDGMLDVCCVCAAGAAAYMRTAWAAFRKRVPTLPFVRFYKGRYIEVRCDQQDVPIQVDGDPAGYLPVRYELQPRSVSLIVPPEHPGW